MEDTTVMDGWWTFPWVRIRKDVRKSLLRGIMAHLGGASNSGLNFYMRNYKILLFIWPSLPCGTRL